MSHLVRVRPSGRAQLRVIHKLLPRPFYWTFDSELEAREYGGKLDALLDRGIVPVDLMPASGDDPLVSRVLTDYAGQTIAPATREVVELLADEIGVRLSAVTYRWAESWVRELKRERRLAPGTIRKRVGALSAALDWYHRREDAAWANPLSLLPRGYSTYSPDDAKALAERGLTPRRDVERDVRLGEDDEKRIRAALAGEKRPDRERPLELPEGPALAMLYTLIVETGMRLREAYTLRADQVDLRSATINVAGTKGRAGEIRWRQVPIKPVLRPVLEDYLRDRVGLIFPWWSGDPGQLDAVTSRLSRAFARLFEYAGVVGFTEHDLRHTATCKWVEMRNPDGSWMFSEIEICKILGWKDTKMMMRYASIRGSDLARRMY